MKEDLVFPLCTKCGCSHGMGIEDMKTGIITPIDICNDCLFPPTLFHLYPDIDVLENWKKIMQDSEQKIILDMEKK